MLSLPDFREKQILFIGLDLPDLERDSIFSKDAISGLKSLKEISFLNENLTIKKEGKIVQQVPFHKIFSIFVVGNCTLTNVFIKKCMKYGVILVLMDRNFSVYSVIGGETEGNFLLREKQYLQKNNLKQAKWLVENKIQNQLQLLKNVRGKSEEDKKAIVSIQKLIDQVRITDLTGFQNLSGLLGLEGNASKLFFQAYFREMNWHGRKPRTKYDELNVLFDIGYTYLFNFIDAHLRLYGFDTYKGFYHTEFYQRKSLTCDLVEPFRCLIDRAILKAHNLKQFDVNDFEVRKNEYHLKRGNGKKYSKIFLEAIMKRKEEIFVYLQVYYRQIMKGEENFPIFKI